MNIHYIMRTE